jgi:hypothetical protein
MRPRSTNFNGRGTGERYVEASHHAIQKYLKKKPKNPVFVRLGKLSAQSPRAYWRRPGVTWAGRTKAHGANTVKQPDAGPENHDAGSRPQELQGSDHQDNRAAGGEGAKDGKGPDHGP